MARPATPTTTRLRHWSWTHPYTVASAALFIGLAVQFLSRRESEWRNVFVTAAEILRQGGDLYQPRNGFAYPAFLAWAALPFTFVPMPVERVAWLVVNLICLTFLARWGWRLAGGGRLQGQPPVARGEHWAAVFGFLCGASYLWNCMNHQQTDIVIGALLLGGCVLLNRERSLGAAVCFGLAAAMKCTALLWAPYLLWRRRSAAAVCVAAVALGANFLPDLVSRPPVERTWLGEYWTHCLKGLASEDRYPGTWGSDVIYNQSLAGGARRWLTTSWTWTADDCAVVEREEPLGGPRAARAGVYAAALFLLLGTLWVAGRPLCRLGPDAPGEVGRQGLECGAMLLLMLLLSPMSSLAHFGVLTLPGFCLGRAGVARRDKRAWAILLAAAALALTANKSLVGARVYSLTLWYGSVTAETLILLLGCCLLLWEGRKVAALRATAPVGPARQAA